MKTINKFWPYGRVILLIIVGVFNTVLIRPEEAGTWKNYLGYALLIIGVLDGILQLRRYFKQNGKANS